MKKEKTILIFVLISALLLTACGGGQQQAQNEPRTITVTGEAEVRVAPDEVIISLGIETWNEDLEAAKAENDERVARVLALIQEKGIEPKHIQTDHINVEPRYHDNYEKRSFIGFFVRKNIVVTLRDLTQFEKLLTDVLQNGVNYVHGIEFRTTDLRTQRDKARELAIQAAREKAEALAGALGQQVGKPRSINEDSSGWWSGYSAWWGRWGSSMTQNVIQNAQGSGSVSEDTIAPGQIAVNARVTVSFDLR